MHARAMRPPPLTLRKTVGGEGFPLSPDTLDLREEKPRSGRDGLIWDLALLLLAFLIYRHLNEEASFLTYDRAP